MPLFEKNQRAKDALDLEGVMNSFKDSDRKSLRTKSLGKRILGYFSGVAVVSLAIGSLAVAPALGVTAAVDGGLSYWNNLSSDLSFEDNALPQHTVLLDKDGKEFATFYSEDRQNIQYSDISPLFIEALVATEDSKFYEHKGVDFQGIGRATIKNLEGSRQGASTITQQLVKNLRQLNAKTPEELAAVTSSNVFDKMQEAKLAILFEQKHSKQEILEQYSNTVYFGAEAYGISASSRRYFNKEPKDLTLDEAALLAGLVNNPNVLNPEANPEGAKARRDTVLGRLLTTGKITQKQFDEATAKPITLNKGSIPNGCGSSAYPYYCSYVIQEIKNNPAFGSTPEIRAARLKAGGMTIRTALDRHVNDTANASTSKALGNDNRVASSAVSVEPGTGHILSFAQNRDFAQTQMNYGTSGFQVGSSFKPFTLALALSQGQDPREMIYSNGPYSPTGLDAPPGGFDNDDPRINWGNQNAYGATANSLNIYYIKMIERYGVIPTADMAANLGITSLPRTGPHAIQGQEASLTLGAYDISPLDMATAYATFASGGVQCAPVASLEVTKTATGEKLPTPSANCHQAITPYVANEVSDILKGVLKPGGTSADSALAGREGAGKTGTTNDFAATWFVGYTPQLSTAVWVGDPRGGFQYPLVGVSALGKYFPTVDGSYIAAPIWKMIMDGSLAGVPNVNFPTPKPTIATDLPKQTVPNVIGLEVGHAVAVLKAAGYTPSISTTTKPMNNSEPNSVVAQSQDAGSVQTADKNITLTLTTGSDTSQTIPSGSSKK